MSQRRQRESTQAVDAGERVVVTPEETDELLINPGKGWMIFSSNAPGAYGDFPEATVAYLRVNWCDLEPAEGRYDWDCWEPALRYWIERGKRVALGVMCANAHSAGPWCTPEWVRQAGAQGAFYRREGDEYMAGTPIDRWEPDYGDPVFLAKLDQFLKAFGARYDGDPAVEFVDIRSYGIWGEWHTSRPASLEVLQRHVDLHLTAFPRTPLVVPWGLDANIPVYRYAFERGVGFRRDGVCGPPQGREAEMYPLVWGRAPVVFELWGHYEYLKAQGWWTQYPLEAYAVRQRAAYVTLYHERHAGPLIAQEPDLVRRLGNRMGYWFVLKEASYPADMEAGGTLPLTCRWENRGVEACLRNYPVALFLTDAGGQAVFAAASDTRTWAPAAEPGTAAPVVQETLNWRLPRTLPAGEYEVRIGLVSSPLTLDCAVKLGIMGRDEQGRYPLGGLTVRKPKG
jgi:hypothetical protein